VKYRKRIAALLLVALLAAVVAWLLATTSGLQFILARAQPLLPVSLDIESVEGRLVGPLSLAGVDIEAPGFAGRIERIELDWRPVALMRRTAHIDYLRIHAPRLALEPGEAPPPETEAPQQADALDFSLPLDVVIGALEISDGSVHVDGAPVIEAVRLSLAGEAVKQRLSVSRLELSSDRGDVSGHLNAGLDAATAWDVDLRWRVVLEESPLEGHTRVAGRLEALELRQEVSGLLEARLEGRIEGLPGQPDWDLQLQLDPLPAREPPWPELLHAAAAELRLSGALEHSQVTGHLRLPGLLPGRIGLAAAGGLVEDSLQVETLTLELEDGTRFLVRGQASIGEPRVAEFVLEGTDLGWPLGVAEPELAMPRLVVRGRGEDERWELEAEGRALREGLPPLDLVALVEWADAVLTLERLTVNSPEGEIDLSARGRLVTGDERLAYRLEAEGAMALPDLPEFELRLAAAGDEAGADIEALELRLLEGTVEGAGRVAWDGTEAADFTLHFGGIDPSSLAPDWPGRLDGVIELRGLPTDDAGLEIVLSSLDGELRALPVDGAGALNVAGDVFTLRPSQLSLGQLRLEAEGRLDEATVSLFARIEAPDLERLDAQARGQLSAVARIEGSRETPRLVLEADGERLRWQANRLRRLAIEADLDASGERPSLLRVEMDGFATAPGPGSSIRLVGDGTPERHQASLRFERPREEQVLSLVLAGGLDDKRWDGTVEALRLLAAEELVWELQQAASLSASAEKVVLEDACMDGTLGRLCLGGEWLRDGPWKGRAALAELDLGPLSQWLGAGLLANGVVTGDMRVEADDVGFQSLSGGLTLTAGHIRAAEEDSQPLVSWDGGTIELAGDEAEARLGLSLALAGVDELVGHLNIGWNEPDPPLDGRIEARLGQLQLITELLPDLADLEGFATAQGELTGTLRAPVATGRFEWQEGAAYVPLLGLRLRDIKLVAALVEGILSFDASGRSGDGEFLADGRFDLRTTTMDGRATLRGEDLLLVDLPEARVAASPQLELNYRGQQIRIQGEVSIPFARISGVGTPGAVSTSPDEIIVGQRARVAEDELLVTSRVNVTVGPDVQVNVAGLRGRVEGSIQTVIEPQALPWGRGELRVIDGTFGVFGQSLEIDTGRLIYTGGPLENPGLDIRAVRRVDEITAGARVRGTLQQPEISVYSEPPLPRAEALSYLTLGKSLDELQAGEQSTVNQAASSLALSGGGLIAQDLGRRLGFDDVSVTADDEAGAAVVVSKYLGGGLYVSYGLGLFDAVNTVRLRYQINQRLSLEATSGHEAAADLFYTFERE
jgi:translocation and assembly module TamB